MIEDSIQGFGKLFVSFSRADCLKSSAMEYFLRYHAKERGAQTDAMAVGTIFDSVMKSRLTGCPLPSDYGLDTNRAYELNHVLPIGQKAVSLFQKSGFEDRLKAELDSAVYVDGTGDFKVIINTSEVGPLGLHLKPDLWWVSKLPDGSLQCTIQDFKVNGSMGPPGKKKPQNGWKAAWNSTGFVLGGGGRAEKKFCRQIYVYFRGLMPILAGKGFHVSRWRFLIHQCCWPWWYEFEWSDANLGSDIWPWVLEVTRREASGVFFPELGIAASLEQQKILLGTSESGFTREDLR